MVGAGLWAWQRIISSPFSTKLCSDIDEANTELIYNRIHARQDHIYDHDNIEDGDDGENSAYFSHDMTKTATESSPLLSSTDSHHILSTTFLGTPNRGLTGDFNRVYGSNTTIMSKNSIVDKANYTATPSARGDCDYDEDDIIFISQSSTSMYTTIAANNSAKPETIAEDKPLIESKTSSNGTYHTFSRYEIAVTVRPLCLALFLTMTTSIFQASFFAYASSTDTSGNTNIEQILYFTRLFLDLAGRPLATLLPRPWFVKTPAMLYKGSIYRLSLFIIFFLYIFFPNIIPQNDILIVTIVGTFSLVNGYFCVLIYEYASKCVTDHGKNAQTYATTLLNIVFQMSSFCAVLLSTLIVRVLPEPAVNAEY